LANEQFLSILS